MYKIVYSNNGIDKGRKCEDKDLEDYAKDIGLMIEKYGNIILISKVGIHLHEPVLKAERLYVDKSR